MYKRIKELKYTPEKAFDTPPTKRNVYSEIEYKGEVRTLKEWCELLDLNYAVVRRRLTDEKMDPAEAFEKPIQKRK